MTNLSGTNLYNGTAVGAKREGMESPSKGLALMPRYEAYKDSYSDYSGLIPCEWKLIPIRAIFEERNEKNTGPKTDHILSVTRDRGVIPYDEKGAIGNNKSEDIERYKLVYENDLVINKMNVVIGSLGLSKYFGALSQVYIVLRPKTKSFNIRYYAYLFHNEPFYKSLIRYCTGIMELRESLNKEQFKQLYLPFPTFEEQTLIANFLDMKTAQIDDAIAIKEQQISLLKERKQIIIQQAVTQGLDPNVPMKDSGVDWIGKVPAHWEVRRSKFVFTQRKERAWKDDVQLSATQAYGVIPQDQYEELTGKRVVKIQFHLDKRKHVEKDDFVISMRSFQGGLERAWSQGCIRSSYVVLRALDEIDPSFYGYLLKLPSYIAALQQTASFIRDGQDLNFDNFSKVDLFIPPIEEQKEIANYVSAFMKSSDEGIELLFAQIEKLKEYKTSLINSAVTGKIKITPEMIEQ